MEKYIMSYTIEDGSESFAEEVSIFELAEIYGFSDCNGYNNFHVYKVTFDGLKELEIKYDFKNPLLVSLYDNGKLIDCAEFEDH